MNTLRKFIKNLRSKPIYIYILLYTVVLLFLSLFRNASADEAYYLKEVSLVAELLRHGIWLGDYGVGLHGVLFKIPVALIYIIIGKSSIFLATSFTILLTSACLVIFYKIVREYFLKEKYAIWATILFSVTFHLLETTLSFNRDIPAAFTVLLFVLLFLRNAKAKSLALIFLLMLDAKEHVFLTVSTAYLIYLIIDFIRDFNIAKSFNLFGLFLKKIIVTYSLSFVWIILMFTTSIVPMNMFVASIGGVIEAGQDWNKSQFSTEVASQNLMEGAEKNIFKVSELSNIEKICSPTKEEKSAKCVIISLFDTAISYFGKILYPRTFSFISIPKIIVLPAIIHAMVLLVHWYKKQDKKYLLPIMLFVNIAVVILRVSHGRYMLGVSFLFILFFILFLKDGYRKVRYFRNVLLATTIFVLLGLLFETTFLIPKIILELSLLISMWSIWFFRNKGKFLKSFTKKIFLLGLITGMFLTYLAFSYEIGQISSYIKYGNNREIDIVTNYLKKEERVWINDFGSGELINVYRENYYNEPEWNWELASWIPKKHLLKTYSYNNTFSFGIDRIESFYQMVNKYQIEKIALVVSTLDESLLEQDKLPILKSQNWLKLINEIKLKNKILYIFEVKQ